MTQASDMIDAGLRALHEHAGGSCTYTEAGVAGQAATALEIKATIRGDDIQQDFVFRSGELTVSDTAWRGSTITGTNSKVWKVEKIRNTTPGTVTFTASRPLERS